MAKPTVHVTVKTEKYGHVVIVTPDKGKFDERLLDSDWYEKLAQMSDVDGDISLSATELRIGRSRKDKDDFLKAILPKIQEQFVVKGLD